eukprot:jgi/Ulvmu1/11828/UM080_0039.1
MSAMGEQSQPDWQQPPPDGGGMVSKKEIEDRGSGTAEGGDPYDSSAVMRSECRTLFTCVMFLTRLPVGNWADHHPTFLMRSMAYFPFVGILIGAWGAVWFQAAAALWGASTAAAVSTLATVWLTGCFHEDGLADTMDGFGGGWGKAQILRIMKDSRVGTYALVGTVLVQAVKLTSLAALPAPLAALPLAHALSRWVPLPISFMCSYIQDEEDAKRGLYNWFAKVQELLTPARLAAATAASLAVAVVLSDACTACLALALCSVIAVGAAAYAEGMIGGIVGDFLGATVAMSEVAIYLLLRLDLCHGGWERFQDGQVLQSLGVLAAVVAGLATYCSL